jgi:hypothetical protein
MEKMTGLALHVLATASVASWWGHARGWDGNFSAAQLTWLPLALQIAMHHRPVTYSDEIWVVYLVCASLF